MTASFTKTADAVQEWHSAAHRTWSTQKSDRVFLLIVALPLLISLAFALHGVWLIMLFSGAESLCIWLAYLAFRRSGKDFERVRLSPDLLSVELQIQGQVIKLECYPAWAKIVWQKNRLFLTSHGRKLELGRLLAVEERKQYGSQLMTSLLGCQ